MMQWMNWDGKILLTLVCLSKIIVHTNTQLIVWQIKIIMDAVQQARCVSLNEATKIRENLLNLE